ncbi:hypothetical protein TL16_g00796 [Triparma laevis f. inornata]|uniref:Kinesin light chain n=1 Tax=Triparma laevis f. inornata TaxID=1714386 RepID=A0A9W6ZAD3_9STRA|nr:hypothetical protein TL16_g00796 [Triparma laevis f. inornata]
MINIAVVYDKQGDLGEAEEYLERGLEGFEAQLGKDHETTKRAVQSLYVARPNFLEHIGNSAGLAELEELHL